MHTGLRKHPDQVASKVHSNVPVVLPGGNWGQGWEKNWGRIGETRRHMGNWGNSSYCFVFLLLLLFGKPATLSLQ